MTEDLVKKIKELVSESDYRKGVGYPKYYIDCLGYRSENGKIIFSFEVESETSYQKYNVGFIKDNDRISCGCSCTQFYRFDSCKHVAACLYNYGDQMFEFDLEKENRKKSIEILNSLTEINSSIGSVKQELKLEVGFEVYYGRAELKLRIGKDKLYMLKNKLGDFLRVYKNKQGNVTFGKGFIYKGNKQYFNKIDSEIIDFVYEIISETRQAYYSNGATLILNDSKLKALFKILRKKSFTVSNIGLIKEIKEENPFEPKIFKKDNEYFFDLNTKDFIPLTRDYEYIVKDGIAYHVTENYSNLINVMHSNGLEQLIFEEKDLPTFSKKIIPLVKEEIVVDESVDNLVIVKKPAVKLYFDIYYNDIICNIKLMYGEKEMDYFKGEDGIVRDIEFENSVLKDVLELGFVIDNNKLIMSDMELIGEFFETKLEKIASKYDTYTSEKIKNTKIVKYTKVSSTFSIGSDNIMSFSFDLGDISNKELDDIFDNLSKKKRYYKLKSGNILDLENNNSLKQLEELSNELNLSNKDIINGEGIIPKYRAIYLDSLKKDKFNIIKTNNLFDNFIDNFKNYKNQKLKLTKKYKDVLRDYQETGVEWLYNIHKCDLGGILADEMGLGKSIQVIYFFKKLLEEDKSSKFLIVSPTSLIYNWKEEFDKFAPKINYEILSAGKDRRHELLENSKANVFITSYGLVREDLEYYKDMNFTICVIDEAQNIKNPVSGITKAVKKINAKTKIALTGTPIENSVVELWSIFDYIMPSFFFNQKDFQSKYKVKDFDEDTNTLLSKLNKQIEPFILRRKKQDVLKDLPEKIENNIFIDLSKEQKNYMHLRLKE